MGEREDLRMEIGYAVRLIVAAIMLSPAMIAQPGIFEGHGDVGTVLHPGSVEYDAAQKSYRITASGENIWGTADAFQFVWKKVSGDVSLTAEVAFTITTGDPHKKAVLMAEQIIDLRRSSIRIVVYHLL